MRLLLLCAFCTVLFVSALPQFVIAQPVAPVTARKKLSIGAGFAGGASMLLNPATNWKVSPVFAYRATLDFSYPLSNVVGVALSFGFDRRGGEFYWYEDKSLVERRMVNYMAITPSVNLRGILIGLNLGFPMGGSRTYQNGGDATERTLELDADKDKLLMIVEPRLTGVVPLIEDEFGWLGLTIGAGYNFGDMSERMDFAPGSDPSKTLTGESASAHIGLTWQFAIPGTGR